eukprot:CAMPEP_0116136500 /NCGR_PEP_ID=MMETSP0329-20121206/11755_1 /TAXON_ID=697910 /ORGANISM="Pseudo-nitzschia arenysensis, Strain B593" /LENGTH=848 /DNA_ID=CAMNT_0003631367 /DNA_START=105 /DNA_END=2651 /DNA_ORIENTATION=-
MILISSNLKLMKVSTTRITWFLFLCLCLCFLLTQTIYAFVQYRPTTRVLSSVLAPCPLCMTSVDNDDDDDEDELDAPAVGRPVSRMTNFAAQFLDKVAEEEALANESDDNEDSSSRIAMAALENIEEATHLVAIPLEASHELLIELESVQRAILHHCPILLDACIGGTTTRLPLLYIKAPDSNLNDNPQNSASVTTALAGTIRRLVKKHIYGTSSQQKIVEDNTDESANTDNESLNAAGFRPLTMTFQSLEIDGDNHNILNTVGSFCACDEDEINQDEEEEEEPEEGTIPNFNERRFENFMRDLQSAISAQGWQMAFPPDPNKAENEAADSALSFRPRVAFMELPKSFDENLSRFKNQDEEITEEDMKFLRAEEGGNGISPIFWCNWWDDVFARNVRLQEIGIYPTNPMMVDQEDASLVMNSQFYLPFETIALPDGNQEMLKTEKKFLDYHEKRIEEREEEFRKENFGPEIPDSPKASENPLSPGSSKSSEPDVLMTRTRKRLESIYLQDSEIDDINELGLAEEFEEELPIDSDDEDNILDIVGKKDTTRSTEEDYMEDWMRQMIMQASNQSSKDEETKPSDVKQTAEMSNDFDSNKETPKTDALKESKDIEKRMEEKVKDAVNALGSMKSREGVEQEPKYSIEDNPIFKKYKDGALTDKKPKPPPTKKLGPYPGNDHFVGIWKVVVNPMGDDDNSNTDEGSENLLLRVDGTTAAGPTLNPETNQKAAGGTWKMLPQENGDVLLRIRLVIPPEKKRILVMEGRVNRGSQLGMSLASRTFGIPMVEEKAREANQGEEAKMVCSGESYIEDAVTKKDRIRAENFYLEKVQGGKDPDNYTVIIPKTIRRLD